MKKPFLDIKKWVKSIQTGVIMARVRYFKWKEDHDDQSAQTLDQINVQQKIKKEFKFRTS